jgi:hypothetical protein
MISTSFMIGTGFMKCMPMNFAGRSVIAASRVIGAAAWDSPEFEALLRRAIAPMRPPPAEVSPARRRAVFART